jgi:hypothetical protein
MAVPEHITPQSIFDMTTDALDAMLDSIRERRLSAARQHAEAVAAAKAVADDKARMQLLKQCEMLSNALNRMETQIENVEARVNKVRALRLELGID